MRIQELNCKNQIDKWVKNQNLSSKHWGHNFKYHQNLNWRVKLKTNRKRIQIKNKNQEIEDQTWRNKKNQDYWSKNEIENKLKFDKKS